MAEIEFKRRGTPLWAVLLVLLVLALVVWLFLRGRVDDEAIRTPAPAPTPTQPTPGAPPTGQSPPAPTASPVAEYSSFVTGRPAPAPTEIPAYVSDGLRLLAGAIQERHPASGVQTNLLRAMADSLRLPDITPARQTDMAQAAFFAAAYAMGRGGAGDRVNTAASQVRLQVPLREQMPAVLGVFRAAKSALDSAGTAPPAGAAPKS
jgi:hypothetical protein